MNRLPLIALAGSLPCAGGIASAGDETSAFYISPMLQNDKFDKNRLANNHIGGELAFGCDFKPTWAAELGFSSLSTSRKSDPFGLRLHEYNIDIIKQFLPTISSIPT